MAAEQGSGINRSLFRRRRAARRQKRAARQHLDAGTCAGGWQRSSRGAQGLGRNLAAPTGPPSTRGLDAAAVRMTPNISACGEYSANVVMIARVLWPPSGKNQSASWSSRSSRSASARVVFRSKTWPSPQYVRPVLACGSTRHVEHELRSSSTPSLNRCKKTLAQCRSSIHTRARARTQNPKSPPRGKRGAGCHGRVWKLARLAGGSIRNNRRRR